MREGVSFLPGAAMMAERPAARPRAPLLRLPRPPELREGVKRLADRDPRGLPARRRQREALPVA